MTDRELASAEMARTTFQRKAVARQPADAVLDGAVSFFIERGYRSARTGRPNLVHCSGVTPRVPTRARADLTASSLWGLMMAAIFVMAWGRCEAGFGMCPAWAGA